VHRAIFDGARLRESTHPDYPRGMPAPPEAVEEVLGRGAPLVWIREEVAGVPYHNAYLPRTEGGRVTGLLSVGFPSLEARHIWLNTSKVLFLHLLAAGAAGAAGAAAASARGRLRLPPFSFRAKLLAGFVLVGAAPVVGLALLEKSLAGERAAEAMEREVVESLRLVEATLRDAGVLAEMAALATAGGSPGAIPPEAEARIPDERLKEIAYRAGVPVNLFLGERLLASSERGIFATELFPPRLAAEATRQVLLLGRGAFAARERFGSFPFLVGYAPIRGEDGDPVGVLSVPLLFRQDRADRDLARATTAAVALYLVVLLVVAGAGAVLARRVARPVEALVEGTGRVAAGDLSTRIPRGPKDELGDLVDSFNRMTEGLEKGREAEARAQREAAWREMAKQVAHEIKNPLTPMRLHAQHLLRAQEDGSAALPDITRKAAEVVLRQSDALERIARDFAAFARLPRRNPEALDLASLARDAADLYRGSESVAVSLEAEEGLPPVLADREEMRLVLVNLCGNALEAMPSGGRLAIRVRSVAAPPAAVILEVEDSGVGIRPEDLPRLFDPSFSTKTRGTGLGLAIVRRAVEDAGGSVMVDSTPGRGSRFTVRFPAAGGPPLSPA
jgi:signal transduction histidine kinase